MQSLNRSNESSLKPGLNSVLARIRAERTRRAIEATRAEEARRGEVSLRVFVEMAWAVLEPGVPYVHGWHIDCLCAHLEAVTAGNINRLLINIPPGMMKSLLVSVFWPAWEWGPQNRPHLRYLSTSYSDVIASRDARKMRDLVESDWYQSLWGDRVRLIRRGETSFENSRRGNREAMAFTSLTGGRGDRVLIDDPHSTVTAESDTEREKVQRTFRESVPSRVNDLQASAIVIIMQRLHQKDVSGIALDMSEQGYFHVMLPLRFEPDRACRSRFYPDPRRRAGELLFPGKVPEAEARKLEVALGGFATAGQLQQRPTAREGGLFKRAWFSEGAFIDAAPPGTKWVRHWDLAATAKSGAAYTAGVKLGRTPWGKFIVANVIRGRWEAHDVAKTIKATADAEPRVDISLPQDPGQAGKAQAQAFVSMLAGRVVRAAPETGDKFTRASPVSVQAEAGNLLLVRGPWVEPFLDELCEFPNVQFKDQVDALSGAFAYLTRFPSAPIVSPIVVSSLRPTPG